jgi:hypothetical protein
MMPSRALHRMPQIRLKLRQKLWPKQHLKPHLKPRPKPQYMPAREMAARLRVQPEKFKLLCSRS